MDQSINYNLSKYTQTVKSKRKRKIRILLCNEHNKKIKISKENHQICSRTFILSGNEVIDGFIGYTLINNDTCLFVFAPYDQFENIEFIAEGGFSKIYKAIWIDGPYSSWNNFPVVLKKLNNSKNVTSKELNELKIFYEFSLNYKYNFGTCICKYFGITQDPITQDIMIIMPYYNKGDLTNYFITNDYYSISWLNKLGSLLDIISGLKNIHQVNIVHRDLHSGNIFFDGGYCGAVIGDLGISKSATELSTDDSNDGIYGIIPYMAPEIFYRQKYTTASDIYSFGMIMWEFMTGRRPFWDKIHNAELIIEICDGLRPPIVTNAPKGYIELMKQCWHPDPKKRPSASNLHNRIWIICYNEPSRLFQGTKIIESPDIGPVTMNNTGAIYKSRSLSGMISSAMSTRSLRSQSINLETEYTTQEIDFDIYFAENSDFYDFYQLY